MESKMGLRELGFASYDEYLASEHWQDFRNRFKGCNPSDCAVCGCKPTELHHVTYERLGRELFGDVRPLCRKHHKRIHSWMESEHRPVEDTVQFIVWLRDMWERQQQGKPIPPRKKQKRRCPKCGNARKKSKPTCSRCLGKKRKYS